MWVIDLTTVTELDAKIREIPYGTRSRYTPDKGCLTGTRTAFLDFIVNWVNDPASGRSLVLFGQAGTGKSSIAHEIARRFDKIHRLTSSFIFLRERQSKREAYQLFTTLARDLSDRYPSFKTALGRIIRDNSSLRVGTHDYGTLFVLKYGVRSRVQHLGSGMDSVRVGTPWQRRGETRKVSQHDCFTSLVDRTCSLSVIYNRVFYYDQGQSLVPSFEGMRVSALYLMCLRVLYDVFKNA